MLSVVGVGSLDELFQDIPDDLRLKGLLDLPQSLDEHALYKYLADMSAKNLDSSKLTCFLGAGSYDHFIPASVGTVLSRGEFLTSYTPYQPELSQGYLQTIYEFQSMIAEIMGMDVANASLYDAGSGLAEAALLAHGANGKKRVLVSAGVHPNYRQIIKTFTWSAGLSYDELPLSSGATAEAELGEDACCVIAQHPNFLGVLENVEGLVERTHRSGALSVFCSDPIALGVLRPPGQYGADIMVGEGQPLGSPMGFGGPLLGLFAVTNELVRRIPGRVVGLTKDMDGNRGFVMTLRTREQDIRRERATSNICTNQALIALAATVYMTAVGKNGFRQVAETCVQKAHYAAERLTSIPGVSLKFPDRRFGFEFVLSLPKNAAQVRDRLIGQGVLAGLPLGDYFPEMDNALLTCVTEVRTKSEIDRFVELMAEALR